MPASARFAVAVHALTLLEQQQGVACTSTAIARSVNTNPVVVRRVLGPLGRAGIVISEPGAKGGVRLARPGSRITLGDVYRAIEAPDPIGGHAGKPNPRCPIGCGMVKALDRQLRRARSAIERELDETTIADLLRSVTRQAARSA